jgi:DNA-binding transcriptional LysR family regulator
MLTAVRDFDLNDLRVFVRVVDRGGFAGAARELGVPTSTVSRTIGRLESRAGMRLLQRTTRSVRATSEGAAFYASVREAIAMLESSARMLEPASRTPKGILKVAAPIEIGSAFLADLVVAFAERHPAVQVELSLTNRAVDLVAEGVDVAVRAAAKLADSSLIAKKLGDLQHGLYASPRYLERRGVPTAPAQLVDHACIVFRAKDLVRTWRLYDDDRAVEVEVHARIGGDDFTWVRAAAVAGGGIALMPRLACAKDEAAGRLIRVLPAFHGRGASLYLVYPSSAHVPARVTAFRSFVTAAFDAWSQA